MNAKKSACRLVEDAAALRQAMATSSASDLGEVCKALATFLDEIDPDIELSNRIESEIARGEEYTIVITGLGDYPNAHYAAVEIAKCMRDWFESERQRSKAAQYIWKSASQLPTLAGYKTIERDWLLLMATYLARFPPIPADLLVQRIEIESAEIESITDPAENDLEQLAEDAIMRFVWFLDKAYTRAENWSFKDQNESVNADEIRDDARNDLMWHLNKLHDEMKEDFIDRLRSRRTFVVRSNHECRRSIDHNEKLMLPGSWYSDATRNALNVDNLYQSLQRRKIHGEKVNGYMLYEFNSVRSYYPRYSILLDSALNRERLRATTGKNGQ